MGNGKGRPKPLKTPRHPPDTHHSLSMRSIVTLWPATVFAV